MRQGLGERGAWWRVGVVGVWLAGWLLGGATPAAAQTGGLPASGSRATGGAVGTARLADGRDAIADRVIVRFRDGVAQGEQDAAHRVVGQRARAARGVPRPVSAVGRGSQLVELAGGGVDDAVAAYRADPRVLYAHADYVRRPFETPNDSLFGQQYGLTRVGAPTAWNVTHGAATVKIAVLDTGINAAHPDLASKVVASRDFTNSPTGTGDAYGHGTHVAGIAAAATNNGAGVAGAGYFSTLMNGKVLPDDGNGSISDVVNGIYWAADNGASVINMSLGGLGSCLNEEQVAIDYAMSRGVVVVAAAGNRGDMALQAPASCNNVVSVASTDQNDVRSSFSTHGAWVKIAAPGSDILSSVSNGGYGYLSGTSMATPLVAGSAALVWSTAYGTSAQSVVDRLYATANPIAGTGTSWLHGRVNVCAAVTPQPALAGFTPAVVASGGGDFTLTVNGASFLNGAIVRWNGVARPTAFVNSTRLTATIPAADIASAGTFTVSVATPCGQVSGGQTFTVLPTPTIASLAPASVRAGGADFTLTVNGTNFESGSVVRWNGAARTTTFVNGTRLTAIIPAADTANVGSAAVTVANPGGPVSGGFPFTIAVPPPRPMSVSPGSGPFTGNVPVTISGSGFRSGVSVMIGGNPCIVGAATGTAITCTTPAGGVGRTDVVVTNTDGTTGTLSGGYEYQPLRVAAPTAPGGVNPGNLPPARAVAPTAVGPLAVPNPIPPRR